jgi:hypothetical protein
MESIRLANDISRRDESWRDNLHKQLPNHQAKFPKVTLDFQAVSNDEHEQILFRVRHKFSQNQNRSAELRKSVGHYFFSRLFEFCDSKFLFSLSMSN